MANGFPSPPTIHPPAHHPFTLPPATFPPPAPPIEFHDAGNHDDTESRGRHPVTKLAYACGGVFAVTLVAFGFAGGFSSPDVVSSR